jgi:hypothetical protein
MERKEFYCLYLILKGYYLSENGGKKDEERQTPEV